MTGGVCASAAAAGASCTKPLECCSNLCEGGKCVATASVCTSNGDACTTGTQCCSATCTGGKCQGNATCQGPGATCAKGFDCCAGTCNGGKCVAPPATGDGGTAAGACLVPEADCTASASCCSGRCEPVTGKAGVIKCTDACKANGVPCARAQDCCSLGCFGGVCANKICVLNKGACNGNAECCSGICGADKTCAIDEVNSRCRPTGESCNTGPQQGCCLATPDNDLCDKTQEPKRCMLPPTACKATSATCASDADCCSGFCDPGTKTCSTKCSPSAGKCTTGADCCSGSCTNGSCDAVTTGDGGAPVCTAVAGSCTSNADCCTRLCFGGFCDVPRDVIR